LIRLTLEFEAVAVRSSGGSLTPAFPALGPTGGWGWIRGIDALLGQTGAQKLVGRHVTNRGSGSKGPDLTHCNNVASGALPYIFGGSMSQFTTLVVEDDTLQREAIADLLRDRGLEVIECTTAEAAKLLEAVLD
jgi:hypothetical protein